ncbi:MAG: hypothetical protein U9Q69_00985 [Nanoarchaeota archaeon]|nr:hypothetical protein [Nanoarchaeota archaeon]
MDKKGATHVDWAVSMGIFVVYILSMFIFVQPGVQKVFREDNLINIIETNIKQDIQVEHEKTPLIVEYTKKVHSDFNGIKLQNIITPFDAGGNEDFMITDSSGNELGRDIEVGVDGEADLAFNYDFPAGEIGEKFLFYLFYAPGFYAGSLSYDEGKSLADADISFGTTERDIYNTQQALESGCEEGYKQLKADWGYPQNKDFNISFVVAKPGEFIPLGYGDLPLQSFCEDFVEPYEQSSIFVKELVVSLLDDNGERRQARINLRIW